MARATQLPMLKIDEANIRPYRYFSCKVGYIYFNDCPELMRGVMKIA